MPRKTYTREFKREAARLAEESDRSLDDLAGELGIHPNNLYKWRQQFIEAGEEALPGKGNLSSSEAEMRRLRRENLRLREDVELKNAGLLQQRKEMRFRFIKRYAQRYRVGRM